MLKEYFKHYIKYIRNLSDRTVGHYITGINTINVILEKYNFPVKNLFEVYNNDELNNVREFINNNAEFIKKDTVGNRMYSAAFNRFYEFVGEEESYKFLTDGKLDIIISKPQLTTTKQKSIWKRNQILVEQVIKSVHYNCEYDNAHKTFTSKVTGQNYVEGHHLIPMSFQDDFDCNLDIYANIISLCPICHRLLHHGIANEKIYVLNKLFDMRCERLKVSGIDFGKSDFLRIVGK